MRKIRPRNLFNIIILVTIISGFCYFFAASQPDMDREEQLKTIERSILSWMDQSECRMPNLSVDNPTIMKFYHSVEPINCGNPLDDWVMCEKSICYVKPEITAKYGEVTCSYADIIPKNDFKSRFSKSTPYSREPYVLQASDFAKVTCIAENEKRWIGLVYGIRDGVQNTLKHKPIPPPLSNGNLLQVLDASKFPSHFNILMYGYDSLSHNAVIRKLPKTYNYLTNVLDSIILKSYNIVGDGTPQALIPILTGFTELELPDTRKRISNTLMVDEVYPFIWNDYKQQGYVTSFNEDAPHIGTFTYRLNGFKKQPVHHYLRTFYLESNNILFSKDYCISHQPNHLVMMDYTKNFMIKYSDTPRFVFSFHASLSHGSINLIQAADDDMVTWLEKLKQKQLLENTILIFMSDHGNRFQEVRNTLQGKQEERLPFFSFAFPDSFKKRFPREYANFVKNSERLTTPFDIHATLAHILELQSMKESSTSSFDESFYDDFLKSKKPVAALKSKLSNLAKNRAKSLFKPLPQNRSCAEAYIEPHWCACLNWKPLNLNVSANMGTALRAADTILNVINKATETFRSYCNVLQLKHINWAMHLRPHNDLLAFKKSSDIDGFLPDLNNGNSEINNEIVVTPGDSLFEASVSHNLNSLAMQSKLSDISRVNKYGSQANCIYERNPELRKYCYCKKQNKKP
uniref:DUF229 domain-containing protein n=1 Tax=Glossina brevipalpis TaxID=37001 RepID=A0A1A9X438_9MUSC